MIFQLVSISITSATPNKPTPEIAPKDLSVAYHSTMTPTAVAGEFSLDPADPYIHYFGKDAVYGILIQPLADFVEGDQLNLKVTARSLQSSPPSEEVTMCLVRVESNLNAYAYVVFRGGSWQVINLEDFYQVALEWSLPYAEEPKPKLFSLSAWNIANPIPAFVSEKLANPNLKPELEVLLDTLCRTAANLGLNTAVLDDWAREDRIDYDFLAPATANQIADAAGIRKRFFPAQTTPTILFNPKGSKEAAYPSNHVFSLISYHQDPVTNTAAYDLYFGGLTYTEMFIQALDAQMLPSIPPLSPLQLTVQDSISLLQKVYAVDATKLPALERFFLHDEPQIYLQKLAPEYSQTPAFVRCLDYVSTALLPETGPLQFLKRCFQDQGQFADPKCEYPMYIGLAIEIGLFRQAYLTYLKKVHSSPLHFGFPSWDLVSPPPSFLAGAVPVQRAGDPASRRLYYWTLRFLHGQISEGWAAQSIALNKQLKSLGHPTGCYSHCTNNARFGCTHLIAGAPPQPAGPMTEPTADSRYSSLLADWFSDSRANLGLRAQGFKEFLVQPEDDDSFGYVLHHATAKAALLRSASLVGTEAGTSFVIKARVLGLNPDELVYRALAFIGNGAKSIDYFNFQGSPAQGDHWSSAKACYSQIATISRILANAEPVLYAAKPVLSRVAIVISSSSDIVASPGEDASGNWGYPAYAAERFDLHVALSRQGFQVDFLDETALIEGRLAQYSVVYLTDPVLVAHPAPGDPRPSTYEQLATWVANGGQLVFGAGAAVINEIGEPIGTPIDQLTGVTARLDFLEIIADPGGTNRSVRPVKREWRDQDEHPPAEVTIELLVGPDSTHPTAVFSTVLGNDGQPLPLTKPLLSPDHEPYCPLTISSSAATVLARLVVPASEEAPKKVIGNAIVRHRYGNGQVYSYSFFPGLQFVATGSNLWEPSAAPTVGGNPLYVVVYPFPSGFATSAGELAALPIEGFGLQPLVEVARLIKQPKRFRNKFTSIPTQVQANALVNGPSMAIVLLNWNGVNADGYRLFVNPINLSISYWLNNEQLPARGFLVKSARTGQVLRYTVKRQNTLFSRLTITLPGFTTADIVTIEPIRQQAPRLPRLPVAGPWQLIGGDGGGDGGSTWIGPRGRILKVPPRQPLVRWLEEVLNLRVSSSLRARTRKGFLARLFANR